MRGSNPLREHGEKRDFEATPEPSGGGGPHGDKPRFVIQKHDSSTLHYDFRIEAGGVLKSWAVPKGPSTDPSVKRLAVPVEDHPLSYIYFEGVIPEGQYGAGTVMVWDRGTYRNLKEEGGEEVPVEESIERGHVTVWLEGEKLRGGYALIRTGRGGEARWLLIKMRDGEADARRSPVSSEPNSVLTGRSMDEIAEEAKREA